MSYTGKRNLIKKHLGFLETEYGLKFEFQTFHDYKGFCGPVDTYSFYNDSGCFTLHNIVQRDEWGWFISKRYSTNQYELLEIEINQKEYVSDRCLFFKSVLKKLANVIKFQINSYHSFFDIQIDVRK